MGGGTRSGLQTSEASPVAQGAAASGSFIGRGPELRSLYAALDRAQAGTDQLVMLAGDAGMGKTRLCQELAAEAARRTIPTIWGRCSEEPGAPPYWPWTQAIRTLVQDWDDTRLRAIVGDSATPIAGILPELGRRLGDAPGFGALEPDQLRFQLFSAITQLWQRAAEADGLLLILDNLHWADLTSLRLLAFLGADLGAHRLMLVGTYRHTEVSRQHGVGELLADLTRCTGYQ
ncbi:MAG: AAA family ATPase, partial [Chromatiaceae bacterium]